MASAALRAVGRSLRHVSMELRNPWIGVRVGERSLAFVTLEIRVGKTILKIYELGLFFVLVFLAFLYFFLAREMCFVPISFFTILHFPPRATRGQGKCKIVKNEIGTKHISRARKNTKTPKTPKQKIIREENTKHFPDTLLNFVKGISNTVFVRGLLLEVRSHCVIALRSYTWPSQVATGSTMISCVMGHFHHS